MRRPSVLCLGGFFRGKRTDSQDSNASAGSAGSDEGDGITIIRSRGKSQDKNLGAGHALGFPLQSGHDVRYRRSHDINRRRDPTILAASH